MNQNEIWNNLLEESRKKSIPLAAILAQGSLVSVNKVSKIVYFNFDNPGFIELLRRRIDKLNDVISIVIGEGYRVYMNDRLLTKRSVKESGRMTLQSVSWSDVYYIDNRVNKN